MDPHNNYFIGLHNVCIADPATENKSGFRPAVGEDNYAWPVPDNRYPHLCPNCNRPAYISLFSVEHEHGGTKCH